MMPVKKIWIVKENEFSDLLTGKARSSRAALLADYFIEEGCEVTAWSSLWSHTNKTFVEDDRSIIQLKPGMTLKVISTSKSYKKNISFARITQERQIARRFRKAITKEEVPDLIYCCWPLIETSYEAVRYGKAHNLPVIIDIRDLWPTIFVQPFPKVLQPLVRIAIAILFHSKASYALRNATMVTGTIPKALALSKEYNRKNSPLDRYVFHCYKQPHFTSDQIEKSLEKWEKRGIDDSSFNIIFFGTIGKRIPDFDTIMDAASRLRDKNVKFILCGLGDDYDRLVKFTSGLGNVILVGLCNHIELVSLASISKAGMIPYRNTADFKDSLPTKFSEYLSSSLIILTSLTGLAREVLESNACGFCYRNSDELVEIVSRLVEAPDQVEETKQRAFNLFKKSFDADVVYRDFVRQLIDLTENSSKI